MIDINPIRAVIRQDLLDVRRSRLLQAVFGGYMLFIVAIFLGVSLSPGPSIRTVIRITMLIGFLFVPLVALLSSYLSIAGERESGTIRFLLGYPITRSEIVLGKAITRLGVVFIAIGLAFLAGGIIAVLQFDTSHLPQVSIFGVTTALFACAFVGMALGVSATTKSRSRAMSGTFGSYFVLTLLWSPQISPVTVPGLIGTVTDSLFGIDLGGTAWNVFSNLSPATAYFWSLQILPNGLGPSSPPIGGGVAIAILIAWVILPPVVGYATFAHADIG